MRALVTGACGFVGNYLVRHLVESGDTVLGTFLHERPSLPGELTQLEITDPARCQEVVGKFRPDVVFHVAGMAFVPDAEKNFSNALSINVGGTYNVLAAAQSLKSAVRVVLVSSAQVYGKITSDELPLREDTPIRPCDNYSLSKAMAELTAARFAHDANMKIVIMRPFNHIGAGQRVEFAVSSFAYQLAEIAKKTRPASLKVGNLDAKRDFTDVRDIVRAYRLAALKGSGAYNLCSAKPISMKFILDSLVKISGLKVTIELDPARLRPSDTPELFGSSDKAQKDLGWTPEIPLQESLASVYEYWLKNTSALR